MILALPYIPQLPVDYDRLAKHLKDKGRNPSHALVVVALWKDEEAAFSLAMGLKTHFRRHQLVTIPDERETGLRMSNRMFRAACKALHEYAPEPGERKDPPMLYYDPGYRPVENHWLDRLQSEYYFAEAPLTMGQFDGKNSPVGPVVLSKSYPAKSKLLDFLPDNAHWREYLSSEIFKHAVKTDAIGPGEAAYIRPLTTKK